MAFRAHEIYIIIYFFKYFAINNNLNIQHQKNNNYNYCNNSEMKKNNFFRKLYLLRIVGITNFVHNVVNNSYIPVAPVDEEE